MDIDREMSTLKLVIHCSDPVNLVTLLETAFSASQMPPNQLWPLLEFNQPAWISRVPMAHLATSSPTRHDRVGVDRVDGEQHRSRSTCSLPVVDADAGSCVVHFDFRDAPCDLCEVQPIDMDASLTALAASR